MEADVGFLALSGLPNVETFDLARWRQLKFEVGPEVALRVRMEFADDIEAVVLDALNRGEAFMA